MVAYLQRHPLVLASVASMLASVALMLVASYLSFRCLRLLRQAEPPLWTDTFGSLPFGIVRPAGIGPNEIILGTDDPEVKSICLRYVTPLRRCREVAAILLIAAVTLLTLAGILGS